jgi:hypothetical protein
LFKSGSEASGDEGRGALFWGAFGIWGADGGVAGGAAGVAAGGVAGGAGAGAGGFTSAGGAVGIVVLGLTGSDEPLVKKYPATARPNNANPITINRIGDVFFFSCVFAPNTDALFSDAWAD